MLRKICMVSIAAATLLAWPALVAWPSDRAAQAERIGDQRIIREIVIDGGLTEAGSDHAPANELRPTGSTTAAFSIDRINTHGETQ